ncbi:23S rRNA pseudouridine2605 synthase [Algoriphagus boseongensis]|uniref:Pseudouridine synthase n=1 Tax=Algoriphagus boseongensis TaxID=1442587 RepID=A0A4R6T0I9_9BACT|nr:pseudouridine synthase [Algoriphagus boseongensis]TDQ13760.1 23S rRNA pseudouridine2605 synthase [Algoriphagus boseongensis]
MKKNNPRKPFFSEDKKDFDSPKSFKKSDSNPKESRFGKKDGDSGFNKKSFGKKADSYGKDSYSKRGEDKPSFGEKPKARFFNEDKKSERPSFGKKFESGDDRKKSFGEKKFNKEGGFQKKFERREDSEFPKKSFGDQPKKFFKKDEFGPKKFEKRGEDSKKPFRKDFNEDKPSKSPGERTVYKGRGRDEKPRFSTEKPKFFEAKPKPAQEEKRGFGKNRIPRQELNQDRPDYNFDNLPAKKSKGKGEEEIIRLNKYVANSGICSRREADDLIAKGLVTVNGEVVTEMGFKVKKTDRVVYMGKRINPEKPVYVLLNKPKDFITTTDDPMERKTVMKLVENACEERIFPIGRLDRNTTGLLLFTNDGELAAKLSHPSNEIKKIYQVTLDKPITHKDEEQILEGLTLEDGDVKVDDMQVLSKDRTILGLEIHIGRNRIVRRLFAHLGYEVEQLDRVMFAGLDKKDLKRGHYRFLTEQEVIRLKYYI